GREGAEPDAEGAAVGKCGIENAECGALHAERRAVSRFELTFYVYQLIGVLAAVLVGMVAVWAAVSNWHWFVRTAIVLAVVMSPLLFSAYEVTVELGVGSALFAGGLILWRRRLRRVANP